MDTVATRLTVVPGAHLDVPLQCFALGGAPARYNPGDALSAEVWGAGQPARALVASADWYTSKGRQTGYDQGQVVGVMTATQTATLQPTARYYLRIFRSASGETEEIATVLIRVRMPSPA